MKKFDVGQFQLPVTEIIPEVSRKLAENNTLIVSAPPGAGKSTLLPLALLNEAWLRKNKILILEPRRLAASSIASRMAAMLGEQVGHTVGYRIRFDNKISSQTRIEVVTEGILTRMLQADNALEGIGMVVFDEFHERSLHADLALALCRESQQVLRPDLRIMVMSATLNLKRLPELLQAPVVESKGRAFPVQVVYTGEQDLYQLPDLCAKTIVRALKENEGDVLAFLPGQAEITRCAEVLKKNLQSELVYPLYGQLSFNDQQTAILPDLKGRRKVVLATSIAETSLTIEGIRIVVDSGFVRKSVFDPGNGLSGLVTTQITLDSAEQRRGRAGRLSSGVCYRMWSKATEAKMSEFRTPEILESDLSSFLLNLYSWGVSDIQDLTWLDLPPKSNISGASELLHLLGALSNNRVTSKGKLIQNLPAHPRIANLLLSPKSNSESALATDIAALLEERDPVADAFSADINLRIEGLRKYRAGGKSDRKWMVIEKVASAYRRLLHVEEDNSAFDHYSTGRLLTNAFPERIASLKQGTAGHYQLSNGKTAVLDRSDDLSHEAWITVAHLDARKGAGKIFLAAPLNAQDLQELAVKKDSIYWDVRKGGLIAVQEWRVGSLVLKSIPLKDPDPESIAEAILQVLKTEGETLLDFASADQLKKRVASLRVWNNDETLPDLSPKALLHDAKTWLWPYLGNLKKNEDFRKLNLAVILQQSLDYETQLKLDELAPEFIVVPSASKIQLEYFEHGEAPVLSVRLQEVFGMLDTPKINGGKTGIVLHLLSPGFKPVQVTSDLRSFWSNTYFEVKKELKRRYPKHSWPDDPLEAEAVRGVKRKT